jgi:1-acyl-sn-glycerol-3-phosphate acyltransferase
VQELNPTYTVPLHSRIARPLIKPIFQGLFYLLAHVKVTGQANVPFGQPYLVAINHISTFDPPFAVAFWPEMVEVMGADIIWKRPGQAQLAWLYHGLKVHRGEVDRALFDKALGILKSGRPLLMAPEGGRTHATALRIAKPGIAFIIEKANVPVVPVGITGTTDDFFKKAIRGARPSLEMRIGKPLRLPPVIGKGDERREIRQQNADLVMAHIAGLLPEHYRGDYANQAVFQEQD